PRRVKMDTLTCHTLRPTVSLGVEIPLDSKETIQKLRVTQGSEMYKIFLRSGRSPMSGHKSTFPLRRFGSGPSGEAIHSMGMCRRRAASVKISMAGPAGDPSAATY